MRFGIVVSALIWAIMGYAAAGTVTVVADRDATLFEHPDGALASGAGLSLFAGRNNFADNGVRRGLLRFDLAGTLPPGGRQTVETVVLVVTNLTESNAAPREYRLHRVLADWERVARRVRAAAAPPPNRVTPPGFTPFMPRTSGCRTAVSLTASQALDSSLPAPGRTGSRARS